ncbi:CIC11C00000006031 [Sungouiella intermedia]|uniref:Ureidoglycolate lyase n=1 Tax=Sungouiella intermedia TaxID=45354 RepID=A0A1L0C3Q0_9ASCO|nr:CIC11C00000006031 [[Candida] intermedia]
MPLKTFATSQFGTVVAQPLTPESFHPYGGVISADHQIKTVTSSGANYGTAVKIHKVAPIVNNYASCPSGKPATANWNIFRCSAPKHLIAPSSVSSKSYTSKVLERHPFSTQTFIPMGQNLEKVSFLVIVASTDESTSQKLPDPSLVKAFICKGNQSVTYGAGTWHAPMVVIDETIPYIDFAVFIHENGVADEDCQECYFEPGYTVSYADPVTSKL